MAYVWWLTQAACERIGKPHAAEELRDIPVWERDGVVDADALRWPDYLKREYRSRYGRAGRGRLWVAEGFPDDLAVRWDDSRPWARKASAAGGIAIRDEDLPLVLSLPGFVTDLDFNLVAPPA